MVDAVTTSGPDEPLAEFLTVEHFPARHGFFTRRGGVSRGPYASLNLSTSTGDAPEAVAENRRRATDAFGTDPTRWAGVHQVHGRRVVDVREAGDDVEADAIVCAEPGWTLRISMADCVPVLLVDPVSGAIAVIHAGWRGTVAGVIEATIDRLQGLGVAPSTLHAALGPNISRDAYQVGGEVVDAFLRAGFPASLAVEDPERSDRARLSVAGAVRISLERAGVPAERIREGGWCTASDEDRFYSHRRDGAATGRHWAVLTSPR